MPRIQEWIYQLEEGKFGKFLQIAVIVAGLCGLAVIFHVREYSNLAHPTAMDMAQIGHNLAQGEGFSTKFIRPFALFMMDRRAEKLDKPAPTFVQDDKVPDVHHPPLFPALLAAAFKILPFSFEVGDAKAFMESQYRYQPEVLLSLLQTFLMLGSVFLTYLLAHHLFDSRIASLSAIAILVQNYLWQSVFSGLPTLLLVNLTLLLFFFVSVLCGKWLSLAERIAGIPNGTQMDLAEDFYHSLILMVLVGGTIGVGTLIDYTYLWLIVPVVVLTGVLIPRWKFPMSAAPVLVALLVVSPWFIRNYHLTGSPFGLAGYSIFQSTQIFPYNSLDQDLSPNAGDFTLSLITTKFLTGIGPAISEVIRSVGGIWILAFFIAGVFLPFRSPKLNYLRLWVGLSIIILILVMPIIRINYPATNSITSPYNLAAWMIPLISIFSIACFFVITDQIELPYEPLRRGFPVLFACLASLPIILTILPPNYSAPPMVNVPGRMALPDSPMFVYDIFKIQFIGNCFRPHTPAKSLPQSESSPQLQASPSELIMTDIPWAYSWYANRPALLITHTSEQAYNPLANQPENRGFHYTQKPVLGLYITEATLSRSFQDLFSLRNESWAKFFSIIMLEKRVPDNWHLFVTPYPLGRGKSGFPFLPRQIFLTDKPRWN